MKQSDPRTAENAPREKRRGTAAGNEEAPSCADPASRLAGKMGEAASCADRASRLAGKMGEAASCADGARPSRVYSSPDPRQRDPRSLRALTGEVIQSEFKNGSADV